MPCAPASTGKTPAQVGWVLALCLCFWLVACSTPDPDALSVTEQQQAAAMLADFNAARSMRNWEAAEVHADWLRKRFPESDAAAKLGPQLARVRTAATEVREHRRLADLWDYQQVAIGKGVQRSATLFSRTVAAEEGEIAPIADAQLVLRDHPEWGRSVYLLLAQSRFNCGKPCSMRISFDGSEPLHFAGRQADSGQGPALFIVDGERFIQALVAAKSVRVSLPKGSGRIPVLGFDVAGYDAARYNKP